MSLSPGSRIALTGATGFVGGHVLRHLLHQGYRVAALTRRPGVPMDGVDWVIGDLDDVDALHRLVHGSDGVVHVAGAIKARRKQTFFKVNVTGTRQLLDAMDAEGHTPCVHLSSLAARAPHLSPYAASKAQGEQVVKDSTHPWVILRPPGVYGPGDRETLTFFRAAVSRLAVLPGSARNRTSLIHVHDLARAVVTALTSPALAGRTLDVHDGPPLGYTLNEIITMIARPDAPPPTLFIPRLVLQGIGALAWGLSRLTGGTPMLTPAKAREICHTDWVCDDRTLFDAGGWQAGIPAARGLAETRVWYENEGWI